MDAVTVKSLASSGWIEEHFRLYVARADAVELPSSSSTGPQRLPPSAERLPCCELKQEYDIPSSLSGFRSGTHEVDVHLERYGIPRIFAMPSGTMWVSVVRPGPFRHLKHTHALIHTAHVRGKYQVQVHVPEQVRAGVMGKVAAAYWFKHKRRCGTVGHAASADPGPVPELPMDIKPLELVVSGRVFSFFRRTYLLLAAGSHRILFLERPGVGLTNKWIEWEARLLHDNYPMDSIGGRSTTAVQGVHYTLLISHQDRNQLLKWLPWVGADDKGCGSAQVHLDAMLHMFLTDAENASDTAANPSLTSTRATAEELTLIVLSFYPLMCSVIAHRKWAIYLFPLKLLLLVLVLDQAFRRLVGVANASRP